MLKNRPRCCYYRKIGKKAKGADRDASPVRLKKKKKKEAEKEEEIPPKERPQTIYDWVVFSIIGEDYDACRVIAIPQEAFFEGFVEWAEEFAKQDRIFCPSDAVLEESQKPNPASVEYQVFDRLGRWWGQKPSHIASWEQYETVWYKYPGATYQGKVLHIMQPDFE